MNNMDGLREHLFATLAALRDKDSPMDVERAKAISEVAKTVIDTARVEVAYISATGGGESTFIGAPAGGQAQPPGIVGTRVHRLKG